MNDPFGDGFGINIWTDDDGILKAAGSGHIYCQVVLEPGVDYNHTTVLKILAPVLEQAMITALVERNLTPGKNRSFAQHIIRSALDGQDSFIDRRNFDRFLDRGN